MIMLSRKIEDNISGVKPLDLIDIDVFRNGYGRQVFSFETKLKADFLSNGSALNGVFIRAPRVTRAGSGVETLAEHDGSPVLLSQGKILTSSFHTELEHSDRLLGYFLSKFVLG
jgi:5'-phosphate synthase pdxT subunit